MTLYNSGVKNNKKLNLSSSEILFRQRYPSIVNIHKRFEGGHCDQRLTYKYEIRNSIVGLWVAHLLEQIKLLQSNTSINM